jgi:hypothetical protein
MTITQGLAVGTRLKEIASHDVIYRNCSVLHADAVALVFEVHRAVTDAGGDVEEVVSQILLPWTSISHIVIMEERS